MKLFRIVFLLLTAYCLSSFAQTSDAKVKLKSYLDYTTTHQGDEIQFIIDAEVENGWHINTNAPKDEFLIKSELLIKDSAHFKIVKINYPAVQEKKYDFDSNPLSVYEGKFRINGVIKILDTAPLGQAKVEFIFAYQPCNNRGTCSAPEESISEAALTIVGKDVTAEKINQEIFSDQKKNETTNESEEGFAARGLLLNLFLVFIGGLALNLTPCVYPLIPITIGYFGGQSEGKSGRLAILGLLYLLGIALTYSIVGVVTALSGAMFGALLQQPIVIVGIVLILGALSLSMFGVYEFKLPDSLVQKFGDSRSGVFGAFFMGLTMGIVAAPCIGPFVLSLVVYVAAIRDVLQGFLLFFFLALGLGLPYFILAIFSGKIKELPRSGVWMEAVKHIFGIIMIGMALWFGRVLLIESIRDYALPFYMVLAGLYLLIFEKAGNNLKGFKYFRILFSIAMFAVGLYFMAPSWGSEAVIKGKEIQWIKYSESEFQNAPTQGKPVIIDFYADWCVPCKELDGQTFTDSNVVSESERFIMMKADLTKSGSPEIESLRKKFNIQGVPTVVFFDSNGNETNRIVQFLPAEKFLPLMKK